MFKNHKKGEIGELKVAADLLKRGYEVFKPVSQNCPCDLVAQDLKVDEFHTVQVKFAQLENGAIKTQFRRKSIGGEQNVRETNTEFDVGAIYCPQLKKCYYVPAEEFEQSLTLRLESERRMNSIRWANEFEHFPE